MAGECFNNSIGPLSGTHQAIVQDADLLRVHVQLVNIATNSGIALDRWYRSITVPIEMDIGRPSIHRLRIVHLFEADYQSGIF
jgi:hypothetical protein